jgi:hypothetical protein
VCPQCKKRRQAELDEQAAAVQRAYGVVPVEEYLAKRADHEQAEGEPMSPTFREDWEVGLYEDTVYINYSGSCSVCGLKFDYRADHPLELS